MVKRSHVTMEMDSERYTFLADRFKVDRPKIIQVLFVDETLIKIGGLEYWP
jgi:transposase-like protein